MSISHEMNTEVHRLRTSGYRWKEVANLVNERFDVGNTSNAYRKAYSKWKSNQRTSDLREAMEGSAAMLEELTGTFEELPDEDGLIAKLLSDAGLPEDAWEVERAEVRSYEMPLKRQHGTEVHTAYSVRAKVRPVGAGVGADQLLDAIAEVSSIAHGVHDQDPTPEIAKVGTQLFIPSIYDVHLEKMAVEQQQGKTPLAKTYLRVLEKMISRVDVAMIGRSLLVVGNDFGNFDNISGTTTKGTPQDNTLTFHQGVELRCALMVAAVQRLRAIAPVTVMCVPGNHDEATSVWLAKYIDAYFRHVDNVSVIIEPSSRSYYRWGENMFMFTHGDGFKPQNAIGVMAHENPIDFAHTSFKEVFCGHYHTYRTLAAPVADNWGVMVRFLPGLSLTDKWHEKNQFVGSRRGAVAYVYDEEDGLIGEHPVFIRDIG